MGAIKLTYNFESSNPLKVVYRANEVPKKGVQGFLSVDPEAMKAPGWSTYRYCFDNPVKYIDPTGRYEISVTLSKETKREIRDQYKGKGKGWRKEYKQALEDKKQEYIQKAEALISGLKTTVERDEKTTRLFETLSGTKKGSAGYESYFKNDGNGPKIHIDESSTNSAFTVKNEITIAGWGVHSSESFTSTILHEYAHIGKNVYGVIGDDTKEGYQGIGMSSYQQLNAVFQAMEKVHHTKHQNFQEVYRHQGNLDDNYNAIKVEGGYVMELLIMGRIVPSHSSTLPLVPNQ